MKTFLGFISFTLSIGGLFVVAYLSSSLVGQISSTLQAFLLSHCGIPSENTFMILWGIVYSCSVILMGVTIKNRCLRRAIKLWVILGILNVIFCLTYFRLNLLYHGIALIVMMLTILLILQNFYLKNTRYLWISCIPILAMYCYSLFLSIMVGVSV